MKPLNPKLNWDEFQKVRAQRKRKKRFLIFLYSVGIALVLGFSFSYIFNGKATVENPALENTSNTPNIEKTPSLNNRNNLSIEPTQSDKKMNSIEENTKPIENSNSIKNSRPINNVNKSMNQQSLSADKTPTEPKRQESHFAETSTHSLLKKSLDGIIILNNFEWNGALATYAYMADAQQNEEDSNTISQTNTSLPKWKLPVALQLQWMPWHSAELLMPTLPASTQLQYVAINSVNASLHLYLIQKEKWRLVLSPQYQEHRFQTHYNASKQSIRYAPNSLVGYGSIDKLVFPIYSDSVTGFSEYSSISNGTFREWTLPIGIEALLYSRGAVRVYTTGNFGLQYVAKRQAEWLVNDELMMLNENAPRFGFQAALGLSIKYQLKNVSIGMQWQSSYRSAILNQQNSFRNQTGVFVEIPIWR